jgi:hypothetical protein
MIRSYSIRQLLLVVRRLPATMPESDRLDKSGYNTHQDHWLGWLGEYNTEGFYGRSDTAVTDAAPCTNALTADP